MKDVTLQHEEKYVQILPRIIGVAMQAQDYRSSQYKGSVHSCYALATIFKNKIYKINMDYSLLFWSSGIISTHANFYAIAQE